MLDNLTILSFYIIAIIMLLLVAEAIATLIYNKLKSKIKYGNAKVGHILKPRNTVKKCKFYAIASRLMTALQFN